MLKNTKVKTKLIAAFTIIIFLVIAAGIVAMLTLSIVSDDTAVLYDEHIVGLKALSDARVAYAQIRINLNQTTVGLLSGSAVEISDAKQSIDDNRVILNDMLTLISNTTSVQNVKDLITDFYEIADIYFSNLEQMISDYLMIVDSLNDMEEGNIKDARDELRSRANTARGVVRESAGKMEEGLRLVIESKVDSAAAKNDSSSQTAVISIISQILFLLIIIVIAIAIAAIIIIGTEKTLRSIVGKLTLSTDMIDTSAEQLSETSESLARGSSEQAAAIEETSATMNETASMVAQNAENTRQAAMIAEETNKSSKEAEKYVAKIIATMSELKESSDKVGRIVKTIDDIAFQTNLLAINATVEAARAGGDAGRSFGVVAEEVRSLAQKSSASAADTTEIIGKNITLTNSSKEAVDRLLEIAESDSHRAEKLGKLIAEINATSEEQASGVSQINTAISQMEKVTQENAAMAEENSASSNSLKDEIINLHEAINIAKSLL